MAFHVITYTDKGEDYTAVVRSSWIYDAGRSLGTLIHLPKKDVDNVAKKKPPVLPDPTWKSFQFRSLGIYETFNAARNRLIPSDKSSDLSDTGERGRGCRGLQPNRKYLDSDSEEEESDAQLPKKPTKSPKKKKKDPLVTQSLPPPPPPPRYTPLSSTAPPLNQTYSPHSHLQYQDTSPRTSDQNQHYSNSYHQYQHHPPNQHYSPSAQHQYQHPAPVPSTSNPYPQYPHFSPTPPPSFHAPTHTASTPPSARSSQDFHGTSIRELYNSQSSNEGQNPSGIDNLNGPSVSNLQCGPGSHLPDDNAQDNQHLGNNQGGDRGGNGDLDSTEFLLSRLPRRPPLPDSSDKEAMRDYQIAVIRYTLMNMYKLLESGAYSSGTGVDGEVPPEWIFDLPFNDWKNYLDFDESLTKDKDKLKKLNAMFKLCDSKQKDDLKYKDMTKRILKLLFTDEFATKLTPKGQRDNHKFEGTNCFKLLIYVVASIKRFNIGREQVKQAIGPFFYRASDKVNTKNNPTKRRNMGADKAGSGTNQPKKKLKNSGIQELQAKHSDEEFAGLSDDGSDND